MRNRFSTSLTALLLAALMLGSVLFMPATALAKRSRAKSLGAFLKELQTDQFVVGRDSNSFPHSPESFSNRYILDKQFRSALLKMTKGKKTERQRLMKKLAGRWSGSCYGIAGTMTLNYLTKYCGAFPTGSGLTASRMQEGAANYYDLRVSERTHTTLSYINFYFLSQYVRASRNRAVIRSTYGRDSITGRWQYTDIDALAKAAIGSVNAGKPFQFGYFYSKKGENGKKVNYGHTVVGCDYFLEKTNQKNTYILSIKFYDENDERIQIRGNKIIRPHFSYIKLKLVYKDKEHTRYTVMPLKRDRWGNEFVYLYRYDYAKNNGSYSGKFLTKFEIVDARQVYYNLKNGGAGQAGIFYAAADDAQSAAPMLSFYDVDNNYDAYRIKPFVYADDAPNGIAYADSCGRLYVEPAGDILPYDESGEPDEGADFSVDEEEMIPYLPEEIDLEAEDIIEELEPADFPPIPVDEGNENLPFGNMVDFDKDEPGYRYECYDEEDGGLDLEIDLLQEGNVGGNKRTYDGYDILIPEGESLEGVSLEYGSSFASVGGKGIERVRFSSDGRLRDVDAEKNGRGSLELYFGTEDELKGSDMFRMELEDFGFLEVYDTEDNPAYADCVVLHTDGLANGYNFTFYQEDLISDDYEGRIEGDAADTWIKIKAFKDEQSGELSVTVWTEEEDGDASTLPTFSEQSIFTRALHEYPDIPDYPSDDGDSGSDSSNDSSSDYVPAARQTLYSGDSTVSLSSTTLSAGDALIAQPLTSGADYNFMLALAGNNEVVKMYDIHLASGQSALGGGMELNFALGARYANEEFTLVHKKTDGSVEYFYARADGNGNVRFTGIYSLSPFMLVKGRISATAVTTPIAEVPATGGAPVALLLLAGLALLRSRRKYTEK